MAKKKLKTKRRTGSATERVRAWSATISAPYRSALVRTAIGLATAACILIGIVIGFRDYLEPYVHQNPRYDLELRLEWAGPMPEWLRLSDNRHILRDIERRARPAPDDRLLDPNLASRIGHRLLDLSDPADQSAGWIERVECVTVRPNGVVAVACRFRQPTAWVLRRGYCYLIDDKAVRLPGRYDPSDCTSSRLMMIDGVRRPPPAVGQSWSGADLRAGLKLVALLVDKPFRPQISRVLVANHGGRRDPNRPHIELATDLQDARVWWGRAPGEEYGLEISASQKVTLLDALYHQWGRIDMRRNYVDITTWPDRIAMPAIDRPDATRG